METCRRPAARTPRLQELTRHTLMLKAEVENWRGQSCTSRPFRPSIRRSSERESAPQPPARVEEGQAWLHRLLKNISFRPRTPLSGVLECVGSPLVVLDPRVGGRNQGRPHPARRVLRCRTGLCSLRRTEETPRPAPSGSTGPGSPGRRIAVGRGQGVRFGARWSGGLWSWWCRGSGRAGRRRAASGGCAGKRRGLRAVLAGARRACSGRLLCGFSIRVASSAPTSLCLGFFSRGVEFLAESGRGDRVEPRCRAPLASAMPSPPRVQGADVGIVDGERGLFDQPDGGRRRHRMSGS